MDHNPFCQSTPAGNKGGDSLAGRYRYFRLHPFSLPEVSRATGGSAADLTKALLAFGGFPEPLLAGNARTLRLWQRERLARVLREDLLDLERVREVSLVEQLVDLLPERVGSLLSVSSLRDDLQVDYKTAERWLSILENLYVFHQVHLKARHVQRGNIVVIPTCRRVRDVWTAVLGDTRTTAVEPVARCNAPALHCTT